VESLFLTVLLPTVPDRGEVTSRDKTLHRFQVAPRRPDLRARAPSAAARRARAARRCRALARARDEPDAALAAAAAAAVAPPTLGVDVVCYRVWSSEGQLWELAKRAAPPPHPPHRGGATRAARHHASDPFGEVGAGRRWMERAGYRDTSIIITFPARARSRRRVRIAASG